MLKPSFPAPTVAGEPQARPRGNDPASGYVLRRQRRRRRWASGVHAHLLHGA